MAAYYNEIDPYAAQWLRNLIAAGHIAPGDVDERDIRDVRPDDLAGFEQCHFFAGIGVWSYALRLAGWHDNQAAWTGSCPCQPFSTAGRGEGFADERHLWPYWFHLISQCRPATVFGEQVAAKNGLAWFDLVQADMEGLGHACGAVPFPSAGVGAPHIRDRNFWVGVTAGSRWQRFGDKSKHRQPLPAGQIVSGSQAAVLQATQPGPVNGFWEVADWLYCRDGKWRPVEPGTFPMADGIANRVGRLRAYGNCINAEAAAQFIAAYRDVMP